MSDVTFGVKVPEELKQQIDNLIKDSGLRTGKDFMQSLINSYVLEKTKESIPEVAEDLKELQVLTQRIDNIYLNLGYRIENITKSQQEITIKEISKKDGLILILQDQANELEIKYEASSEAYNNEINKSFALTGRVNELTESNKNIKSLIEEYKGKNDMLLNQLKQYEKYPEQLEDTKQLLADSQAKNISLLDNIKDKDFELKEVNKTIIDNQNENILLSDRLKLDHKKELQESNRIIDISKRENLKDREVLIKELTFEKDKSLLELKQIHQVDFEKIQDNYNVKIEKYQSDYKALLEKLEQIDQDKKTTSKAATMKPVR